MKQLFDFAREILDRFFSGEVVVGKCITCGTRFDFRDLEKYPDEDACVLTLIEHPCGGVIELGIRKFFGLYNTTAELHPPKDDC